MPLSYYLYSQIHSPKKSVEMKTLSEIEQAIKELPIVEVRQLASWLNKYLDDAWDKQMQSDFETGKLDKFIAKVESEIEANRVRDLNEVLDNT